MLSVALWDFLFRRVSFLLFLQGRQKGDSHGCHHQISKMIFRTSQSHRARSNSVDDFLLLAWLGGIVADTRRASHATSRSASSLFVSLRRFGAARDPPMQIWDFTSKTLL